MKGVIERIISPKETLVIIGNGFDVAHGIKSEYRDFKQFYNIHHKNEGIDDLFKLNGNWSNIELALTNYDVIKFLDSKSYHYDSILDELLKLFNQWVDLVRLNIKPLREQYELYKDSYFLTFNYTETLERIYDIPEEQICHIHGSRLNEKKNYIFGSGSERDIMDLEQYSNESIDRYEAIEEIMVTMNLDYTKPIWELSQKVKRFLKDKDIQMIKVHGHSMGEVDSGYFREIIQKTSRDILWSIDYYNEEDIKRIRKFKEDNNLNAVEARCINHYDINNYMQIKDLYE